MKDKESMRIPKTGPRNVIIFTKFSIEFSIKHKRRTFLKQHLLTIKFVEPVHGMQLSKLTSFSFLWWLSFWGVKIN